MNEAPGLRSREKELELVLDQLRNFKSTQGSNLETLVNKTRWLLDTWDVVIGRTGRIIEIGESFFQKLKNSISEFDAVKITRTLYLSISPLEYFIIGLEELIDDSHRDSVTRCGMSVERIVNELVRELDTEKTLDSGARFSQRVGFVQEKLSLRKYAAAQHFCSTLLTIYDIRNHRGPHDVPAAEELEAKFTVSSFPWVFTKYLEVLQLLSYDLFDNTTRFVELCNSIVTVQTSLAIKPGHRVFSARESIEVLYKNGFFSIDNSLAEVIGKLASMGFNYPKPTVANSLDALTRTFLSRNGRAGEYRYHQKIPPEEFYKVST